jgi:selenocysteine-specific elongation factor
VAYPVLVRAAARAARVADTEAGQAVLRHFEATPFAPPPPDAVDVPADAFRALVREGELVDVGGVVFARTALERAAQIVAAAVRDRGSLTVADVRDLLGSTRRYVVPLVTYYDGIGVTRREGDLRVAGPASAEPADL